MNETVEELKKYREETIQCLRRGEYGYANQTIMKLMPFMQADFQAQVAGHFNQCNYVRVADLLEHLWKVVELPADGEIDTPKIDALLCQTAKPAPAVDSNPRALGEDDTSMSASGLDSCQSDSTEH